MMEKAEQHIQKAINEWTTVNVQTVPHVMCQLRLGVDEFESTVEYQINWFEDSNETLIHNHRHEFYSLCLEGQYTEQLWRIAPTTTDQVIYRFKRVTPELPIETDTIVAALERDQVRYHFPGNVLHVVPSQYHSISVNTNASTEMLTYLRKTRKAELPCTTFLSATATINEKKYEMRPANENERAKFLEKLKGFLNARIRLKNQEDNDHQVIHGTSLMI